MLWRRGREEGINKSEEGKSELGLKQESALYTIGLALLIPVDDLIL